MSYEMIPGFILASLAIIVVFLSLSAEPENEVKETFEKAEREPIGKQNND